MDEARIIAWIDGALAPDEARVVADAVAADPALAATAEAHRRLKARFATAFDAIANEPIELPARPIAEIVSLAQVRAERNERATTRARWVLPGAVAASLIAGALGGQQLMVASTGIGDNARALALSAPISSALDHQRAGEPGAVRIALSFRDHEGSYCRSFSGSQLGGVACRASNGWRLRYAAPAAPGQSDYRMAGANIGTAAVIEAMIAGSPLDAAQEANAVRAGWH